MKCEFLNSRSKKWCLEHRIATQGQKRKSQLDINKAFKAKEAAHFIHDTDGHILMKINFKFDLHFLPIDGCLFYAP